MAKPKILSIGAAVQDVFMEDKKFAPKRVDGQVRLGFESGSKNNVANVVYSTGGGATNAAVTFARHGFRSTFLGKIGRDVAGRAVLEALHKDGVQTKDVSFSDTLGTGYSVVMLAPNGERVIFTYRGASESYNVRTRQLAHAKADWFYISSLSGDFESLRVIMRYAKRHHIKVAINPGAAELKHIREFQAFLPYITLLSVNREEAKMIFNGETSEELIKNAAKHVPMAIITDGPKGSVATDGQKIYKAGLYADPKVIDRTGAGDAFSSGFTAALIAGRPMEWAVTFASANSTSVVTHIGAKKGILKAKTKLRAMPLLVRPLHQ